MRQYIEGHPIFIQPGRFFVSKTLALLLIVGLALPNPAWGLREGQENVTEELIEALTRSSSTLAPVSPPMPSARFASGLEEFAFVRAIEALSLAEGVAASQLRLREALESTGMTLEAVRTLIYGGEYRVANVQLALMQERLNSPERRISPQERQRLLPLLQRARSELPRFRVFTELSRERLGSLLRQLLEFRDEYWPSSDEDEDRDGFVALLSGQLPGMLVVVQNNAGDLLGFTVAQRMGDGRAQILLTLVRPDLRRHGLGDHLSRLLQESLEHAGVREVYFFDASGGITGAMAKGAGYTGPFNGNEYRKQLNPPKPGGKAAGLEEAEIELLQQLSQQDAETLLRLFRGFAEETSDKQAQPLAQWEIDHFQQGLARAVQQVSPGSFFIVAREKTQERAIVGYAWVRDDLEDGVSDLAQIYVESGSRGRRISSALTDRVLAELEGVTHIRSLRLIDRSKGKVKSGTVLEKVALARGLFARPLSGLYLVDLKRGDGNQVPPETAGLEEPPQEQATGGFGVLPADFEYQRIQTDSVPGLPAILSATGRTEEYEPRLVQDSRPRHGFIKRTQWVGKRERPYFAWDFQNDPVREYVAFRLARALGVNAVDIIIPPAEQRAVLAQAYGKPEDGIYFSEGSLNYQLRDPELFQKNPKQAFTRALLFALRIRLWDFYDGNFSPIQGSDVRMLHDMDQAFSRESDDFEKFLKRLTTSQFRSFQGTAVIGGTSLIRPRDPERLLNRISLEDLRAFYRQIRDFDFDPLEQQIRGEINDLLGAAAAERVGPLFRALRDWRETFPLLTRTFFTLLFEFPENNPFSRDDFFSALGEDPLSSGLEERTGIPREAVFQDIQPGEYDQLAASMQLARKPLVPPLQRRLPLLPSRPAKFYQLTKVDPQEMRDQIPKRSFAGQVYQRYLDLNERKRGFLTALELRKSMSWLDKKQFDSGLAQVLKVAGHLLVYPATARASGLEEGTAQFHLPAGPHVRIDVDTIPTQMYFGSEGIGPDEIWIAAPTREMIILPMLRGQVPPGEPLVNRVYATLRDREVDPPEGIVRLPGELLSAKSVTQIILVPESVAKQAVALGMRGPAAARELLNQKAAMLGGFNVRANRETGLNFTVSAGIALEHKGGLVQLNGQAPPAPWHSVAPEDVISVTTEAGLEEVSAEGLLTEATRAQMDWVGFARAEDNRLLVPAADPPTAPFRVFQQVGLEEISGLPQETQVVSMQGTSVPELILFYEEQGLNANDLILGNLGVMTRSELTAAMPLVRPPPGFLGLPPGIRLYAHELAILAQLSQRVGPLFIFNMRRIKDSAGNIYLLIQV